MRHRIPDGTAVVEKHRDALLGGASSVDTARAAVATDTTEASRTLPERRDGLASTDDTSACTEE